MESEIWEGSQYWIGGGLIILLISYIALLEAFGTRLKEKQIFVRLKIQKLLKDCFVIKTDQSGAGFGSFINRLEAGDFDRKLFLGVSESLQDYMIKDPVVDPGVICIGTQGSGKTTTGLGILTTLQASSAHNTFVMIIDSSDKGAGDYNFLFDKENVATCLYDKRKLVAAITLAKQELTKRSNAARNLGSFERFMAEQQKADILPDEKSPGSIYEYEDLMKEVISRYNEILDKMDRSEEEKMFLLWVAQKNVFRWEKERIKSLKQYCQENTKELKDEVYYSEEYPGEAFFFMVFEEFHAVVNSEEVNFLENCKVEGTVANHLFNIARTGRSWGFTLFLMSQRASYTEIPTDLKAGVKNAMVHKLGSSSDAQSFDLPTTDIPPILGRIITPEGFVQFPYFTKKTREMLFSKYSKPFSCKLFNKTPQEIRKSLSGNGSDGMVETFPLQEIIHSAHLFNLEKIAKRIFTPFNITMPDDLKGGVTINRIVMWNNEKYALVINKPSPKGRRSSMGGGDDKSKASQIEDEMKILGIEKLMVISFENIPAPLKSLASIAASKDDLLRIADILDRKEELEEKGMYEQFFNTLIFAKAQNTVKKKENKKDSEFDDDMDFLSRFS